MRITALVASAALLVLAACGDSTAPHALSATGSWTLQSVDGASLPATIPLDNGETAVDVLGSTLDISADGKFTERIQAREEFGDEVWILDFFVRGSWRQDGAVLTFAAGDTTYPARFEGNGLAYTYDGRTWRFVRATGQ